VTRGELPATSPRAGATIQLDHVTKVFGERGGAAREAVHDLSLEIPAGQICVLVGPSGCGKTTTLKMINRLIAPTSGRILIDGADVATQDVTALRRSIGYVIQQVGLFPHLTVGENVATVPRLLGWTPDRQRERTDELLAIVGLDPAVHRDRYPAQLSGGERQRVGVARALAADPPIMLMDEPFGAVDPIVRDRLQNEFLRIQEGLAKTIVFVTHDIDEAIKIGDRIAVMEVGGRLAQYGTPAEILAAPASGFVARFVGADRGLKRLSLSRVGALDLLPAVTARAGDDPLEALLRTMADPIGYLLLVDAQERPIGWVAPAALRTAELTESMATAMSPLLDRRTTLKDALSMLLDADVQAGIVVDRAGAVEGLVTADMIAERMRMEPRDGRGAQEPTAPVAPGGGGRAGESGARRRTGNAVGGRRSPSRSPREA
jgi:osmoprotectant transport system ATP-binding protein